MTAPTPRDDVDAAVVEEVARAIHQEQNRGASWHLAAGYICTEYRRLAVAAVAAYRATQDGGAEEADANGCPDRQHHGVDCPGDACRFAAALAPQAGDGAR